MSAEEPPTKKPRAAEEDWTLTLDCQNKYGYRRFAIPEASATVEVESPDNSYIPFKVRLGERGETEIHVVASERIIAAIEKIEEFAKRQAVLHARSWFGRSMSGEEIGAVYKSPLMRDANYSAKLKVYAGHSTVVAYTKVLCDGTPETSSGQGKSFLEDLIKTRSGLQGLVVTGQLSPMIWSTRKAFGVHFYCQSLNLTERKRTDSVDAKRFEELVQRFCASEASEARGSTPVGG
jgi:hypothetical protein